MPHAAARPGSSHRGPRGGRGAAAACDRSARRGAHDAAGCLNPQPALPYPALMRLVFEDGRTAQLGYCYNVLPGETVDALIDQVRRICGPVRERLGVERLGVGLWIARPAATELMRRLPPAPRARRRARPSRPVLLHAQRISVRRLPRAARQGTRARTDVGRRRAPGLHHRPRDDPRRAAARRRRGRFDLDGAARAGGHGSRRRARRAGPGGRRVRRRSRRAPASASSSRSNPSPAPASSGPPRSPTSSTGGPGSVCAWTAATPRSSTKTPPRPSLR